MVNSAFVSPAGSLVQARGGVGEGNEWVREGTSKSLSSRNEWPAPSRDGKGKSAVRDTDKVTQRRFLLSMRHINMRI